MGKRKRMVRKKEFFRVTNTGINQANICTKRVFEVFDCATD